MAILTLPAPHRPLRGGGWWSDTSKASALHAILGSDLRRIVVRPEHTFLAVVYRSAPCWNIGQNPHGTGNTGTEEVGITDIPEGSFQHKFLSMDSSRSGAEELKASPSYRCGRTCFGPAETHCY
ncbi:hypothetical protein BV20DRAFT_375770 [Pilatotrama ljubarskyi]|nr:hypothetical protein BV20DRAFT_375770 [Pilatotrama ljubarskyi]